LKISKIKTNDVLPKIILSFVSLEDLIDSKQNYEKDLQRLELLAKADFALSIKISKLKLALDSKPKTNQELVFDFNQILPKINFKQDELGNEDDWLKKPKAFIAQFIKIKRTDQKKPTTDFEVLSVEIKRSIEMKNYENALRFVGEVDKEYKSLFESIQEDLKKSNNLQKSVIEIHIYLEGLAG
jgi:hypothetical protein